MGFLDDAKEKLSQAKDKLEDLVDRNDDKVEGGIDKAADVADDRTGGTYGEHIDAGADHAKDALGVEENPPTTAPPATPAPPPAPPANPTTPPA
jgi:hypothetical protein